MPDDNQNPQDDPIASELVLEDPSFADIVEQFVNGLDERLMNMLDSIRASDFEALRTAAHQLKGTGGGFGYPILSRQAAELERHAKASTLDNCVKAVAELKSLCDRVVTGADGSNGP